MQRPITDRREIIEHEEKSLTGSSYSEIDAAQASSLGFSDFDKDESDD
ncbi:hypothetical protein AB1046_08960 [Promicromonospora sp. Populi]